MSVLDSLFHIFKGSNPDASDEEIKSQIDSLQASPDQMAEVMAQLPKGASPDMSLKFPDANSVSSNFDVKESTSPVTMNGRPESLPSNPPSTEPLADEMPPMPPASTPAPAPIATPKVTTPPVAKAPDDASVKANDLVSGLGANNDKAKRDALDEAERRKHKLGILPVLAAGAGDAISNAASAFGAHGTSGVQEKVISGLDAGEEKRKKDFESGLKDDPASDLSRQYQTIITKVLDQAGMKVPPESISKMSAAQIEQQFPQLAKLASTKMEAEGRKGEMKLRQDSLQGERDARRGERQDKLKIDVLTKFNGDSGVKKIDSSIDAANTIRGLVSSGNPIAAASVPTFMARASGEVGNLSEADKAPFGGSRALLSRLEAAVKQQATGKLTTENAQFITQLADIMERRATENKVRRAEQWAKQYAQTSDVFNEDDLFSTLAPGAKRPGVAAPTPSGSKPPLSSFYK